MNKFKEYLIVGVLCLAFVIGIVGVYNQVTKGSFMGSTLTYTAALSQLERYNFDTGLINDLTAVRAPLAGLLTGTGTFNAATVSTSSEIASTTITVTGAALGDYVVLGSSTSTAGAAFVGEVSATNAVKAYAVLTGNTAVSVATTTIYAIVLPRASFVAPSALTSVSTSTP